MVKIGRTVRLTMLLLLGVLTIQCAGSRGGGTAEWGDAESGFRLTYRPEEGITQRYRLRISTQSTQEVMGNEQVQQFTIAMVLSQQALKPTKEGTIRLQVTYDSLQVDAPGLPSMMQQGAENFVGKSVVVVASPRGEVLEVEGAEALPVLPGNQSATDMMRNFFIRLPEQPVRPGGSWSVPPQDFDVDSGGMKMKVRSENQSYTLNAIEKHGGVDALKITSRSTFTINGSGEQMGASFDLSGTGESTGVAYFAFKKGVLLSSSADVISSGVAEVVAPQAMTIPWENVQKVTLELLPSKE